MMRLASLLLLLPLLAFALPSQAQPLLTMPERCASPDSLHYVDAPLHNLAARLKTDEPVRLFVLGTSSSLREATHGLPRTYIACLPEALQPLLLGRSLDIVNLSQRMQSTQEMRRKIATDIIPARPDLVLWQTGAVEAGRQTDVNTFGEALMDGLQALRAANIDVVLVGPQYRPRLSALVDARAINNYMALIAERENVPLFPRYEIMLYWSENGRFDGSTNNTELQMREAEMQNRCLALGLAQMIQRAVAMARK